MADVERVGENRNNLNNEITGNAAFDALTQQYELLVNEIESTDGHLGTALRTVYEGTEPERFLHCLDARINARDKQIQHMCNHHYQGFIESVHSLLQVRSDVDKLKFEIQAVDRELQASGRSLISKGEELVKCRKTQQNIESAIDLLTFCLPVLETYGKLKRQMANKRYYPALKTLEQLEHSYLPRVSKYRFTQVMCDSIPKLREGIKEASMTELKDFLENIRKHSGKIGEIAMKQTAQENCVDPSIVASDLKRKRPAPQPPVEGEDGVMRENGSSPTTPFVEDSDEGLSAQDLIDFSPVYRCLHIYSVLGDKETFESYYRKQRRKQGRLALQPSVAMEQSKRLSLLEGKDTNPGRTLSCYKSYFHEIVGYFVVEDHISNTTTGLVNQTYIDELWDMALMKIVAVLRTHIGLCADTQLLLQIKKLLMVFCLTLRGYGFSTSQLFELLLEVRDQYSEILRKQWMDIFTKIFEDDNYTPILIENQSQYDDVVEQYPYHDAELEKESFPKRFPFSQFVPAVFNEVKRYIQACLEFSEDLHISKTDQNEWIANLRCKILEGILDIIQKSIRKSKSSLLQLTQISINMEHLDQSCVFLEDFIAQLSGAQQDKTRISKLHGQSMFKSAKSEAEGEIYKQIDVKIEEFFDLASYDWMETEMPTQPSGYITDLVNFLRGIFQSFTNLPEKVAQTACMSACKHIAELMMGMIKDDEVKNLSEAALHQLSLDVRECENFAVENPVSGLDGNTFKMAFEDLRQLLDLFITEDWSIYISDYSKPKHKYIRVKPATCIILLEKLKEAEKKKGMFISFKRNERDKKKMLDLILKQLKQLISDHQ